MEIVCSLIWVTLEVLCLFISCKAFFVQRCNKTVTFGIVLLTILLFFVLSVTELAVFTSYPLFKKTISLLICVAFSMIAFVGQGYTQLIVVTLYYLLLGAIDTVFLYGTSLILGVSVNDLVWKKWLYAAVVTVGKSILLFASYMLFRINKKRKLHKFSRKKLLLITIYPVVSIVMLFMVFDNYKTKGDLSLSALVFCGVLIISNFAIVYLSESLERTTQAEQELTILNQSMNLQVENIQALEKSYRAQRTATHEFQHQLQVIFDLLENGEEKGAKDYIKELQVSQTSRIFVANTHHAIVDAILNEKYHSAKDNYVDISYKVNDLSELSIDSDAIVVLLSNLLDNAIEATLRLPDNRKVECSILLNDSLFLSVRNTSQPVEIVNGKIESQKEPKEEHGFGLIGIQKVLKELGAEYAMDYSAGWFRFATEIPIEQ